MKRATTLMIMLLIPFFLQGCFISGDVIDDSPAVYYDDYGRVWAAAIAALIDEEYLIAQMGRSEGYIATDKREGGGVRNRIRLRFYNTEDGGIRVKITDRCEVFSEPNRTWEYASCFLWGDTHDIKRSMNEKLWGEY